MSDLYLGQIIMFGGSYAPRNYSLCYGQLLSIAQNNALFAILGDTYGGDARTTFGLPDFRSRGPVGDGPGPGLQQFALGEKEGMQQVVLGQAQMPEHNHGAVFTPTGGGTTTVPVEIPANNTAGGSPTPSTTRVLGTVQGGGTLYAGSPNTTLEPFDIEVPIGGGSGTVTTENAGSSHPFWILNPLQVVKFTIVVEGLFPPRN